MVLGIALPPFLKAGRPSRGGVRTRKVLLRGYGHRGLDFGVGGFTVMFVCVAPSFSFSRLSGGTRGFPVGVVVVDDVGAVLGSGVGVTRLFKGGFSVRVAVSFGVTVGLVVVEPKPGVSAGSVGLVR